MRALAAIAAAGALGAGWPTVNGSLDAQRHSPLRQITPANVARLGRVFSVDLRRLDPTIPPGEETFPLVAGGTIYATTGFDHVLALDARTGRVRWRWRPNGTGVFHDFALGPNRGLALCRGKLFLLTLDMRIVSLDARTGRLVREVRVADAVPGAEPQNGYSATLAPVCWRGRVFVGAGIADYGARGFLEAYGTDLAPAWPHPYWTVPPRGQGWIGPGFHGGGTVWSTPTIDPRTGTLYAVTSPPTPVYAPERRPGPNPRTDSLVALDALTGRQRWWRQQLPHDEWDYDSDEAPLVFDARIGGRRRRVVSVATKEGTWFAYDARTGAQIHRRVRLVRRLSHPPLVPGRAVTIYPGSGGGVNYAPASFDPASGLVVEPVAETAGILRELRDPARAARHRVRGGADLGLADGNFGFVPESWRDTGSLVAVDVAAGKVAWRLPTPQPERGGVTTTAGGVGFAGGTDGVLRAFETATGKLLWRFQTGAPIAAAPSVYELAGREYLVLAVGGTTTAPPGGDRVARLDVFALGGSRRQSPPPAPPRAPAQSAAPQEDVSLAGKRTLAVRLAPDLVAVRVPRGWRVHVTSAGSYSSFVARRSRRLGSTRLVVGGSRPTLTLRGLGTFPVTARLPVARGSLRGPVERRGSALAMQVTLLTRPIVRRWRADSDDDAIVHARIPLAHARVSVDGFAAGRTDARGRFSARIDVTVPATHVVAARGHVGVFTVGYATRGGRLVRADGEPAPPPVRSYFLTGRVTLAGRPVAGAIVATRALDTDYWTLSWPSDAQGRYLARFPGADAAGSNPLPVSVRVTVGDRVYDFLRDEHVRFRPLSSARLDLDLPPPGYALALPTPTPLPGRLDEAIVGGRWPSGFLPR